MYRIVIRPREGRGFIAHFFSFFETSKLNHIHNRTSDGKCHSAPIGKTSNPETQRRRKSAVSAFLLMSLSGFGMLGCGGVVFGGVTAGTATLVASPSSIDFGTLAVGASADQKVSIANTGSETVRVTSLTLSNADFSVAGAGALPVKLGPGKSLSFSIHFKASDTTDASGELNVNAASNTSTALSSTIKLRGKGSRKASLTSLDCAKASMTGTGSDTCTVGLSSAAPSTGSEVSLASSSGAVKIPSSVKVASGSRTASFVASVSAVNSSETVTLTAKQGSESKSTSIKLNRESASTAATPGVSALSCSSKSFTGEGKASCTISLSSAALSGGKGITLTSNHSAVKVPGSVTVATGATAVSFTADVTAVNTSQTATITASADSLSKTYSLQLNAATSALTLSSTSLAFGNVAVGTAVTKSVTVTSSGTVPVKISSDSITGTGFSVSGGGFPVTLHPGQSAVLSVQYAPTSVSSATGKLTISGNSTTATVSLSGTGTTTAPTVSGLTCASVSIFGALVDACNVSLSGSAPTGGVSVALASSSSTVTVPTTVKVPATAKSASFAATVLSVTTAQSVKLTASTGSVSKSLSLQLNAGTAVLSVNATSISFGSTTLNNPTTQSLTLSSTGSGSVTVKSATATGAGFSVSGATFPVTLNSGQTLGLTLQFDPTATGAVTGQLTITSNSSANATTVISLTGTGSSHKVALSWNSPTSGTDLIAGYYVYRAAGGTTSYQRLNSTLDQATTYTDGTVQSGKSYVYVVRTVDTSGAESTPSNGTTVTIP